MDKVKEVIRKVLDNLQTKLADLDKAEWVLSTLRIESNPYDFSGAFHAITSEKVRVCQEMNAAREALEELEPSLQPF